MAGTDTLRRILIIDDDVDYRKLLLTWLGGLFPGTDIVEYDPPTQGLPGSDYDWAAIDVLLLDYNLRLDPATGLDILHAGQEVPNFPVTLMLTAAGTEEVAVRALKYGIADYLRKEHVNKDVLKTAIEQAFARHSMKRQRLGLLEEMRAVARQESEKIIDEYKQKLSALRVLEEKQLKQERQKMTREQEINKEQIARLEKEQKYAAVSRGILLEEIQNLKEEIKLIADEPKLNQHLDSAQERFDKANDETKRLQSQLEKAVASVDKNHWKLELSRTMEMELAKEAENFKVEAEQKTQGLHSEEGITLLRRAQARQTVAQQKKAATKQKDMDLLDDIANQLKNDK